MLIKGHLCVDILGKFFFRAWWASLPLDLLKAFRWGCSYTAVPVSAVEILNET